MARILHGISRVRELVGGGLLTFLYPSECRVCGAELGPFEGPYFCPSCASTIDAGLVAGDAGRYRIAPVYLPANVPAFACFAYAGAAEAAVKLLKYEGKTALTRVLGGAVRNLISVLNSRYGAAFDTAVTVPLHPRRRRERGFDQSELITRRAAANGDIPRPHGQVLRRVKDTVPQVTLKGAARLHNITGAFAADARFFGGRRVLLVDDVITSGATVRACVEAIEEAGGTVGAAVAFAAPGQARRKGAR